MSKSPVRRAGGTIDERRVVASVTPASGLRPVEFTQPLRPVTIIGPGAGGTLSPVVKATLLPVTGSGGSVLINQTLGQDHASRGCKTRDGKTSACICAGASAKLAWLYEFTYHLQGGSEYARKAVSEGRGFMRVEHRERTWRITNGGNEVEIPGFRLVEYWKLDTSGNSKPDCFGTALPFHPETQCGLRSERTVTATFQVSSRADLPEASIDEYWKVDPGEDGEERPGSKEGLPKTPKTQWTSPVDGPYEKKETIRPKPVHCKRKDWRRFLNDDLDPKHGAADPGRYYAYEASGTGSMASVLEGRRPVDPSNIAQAAPSQGSLAPRGHAVEPEGVEDLP